MSALVDAAARLSDVAAEQAGFVTTAQAEAVDVTRTQLARLVDKRLLERIERGVYAFRVHQEMHPTIRAEWLALSPRTSTAKRLKDPSLGVVSHETATELHEIGELWGIPPHFTLPGRKQSRRAVRLHRDEIAECDITMRYGMLVTTVERTVADLYRSHHDTDHVGNCLADAVQEGKVINPNRLAELLDPLAGRERFADGKELAHYILSAGKQYAPPRLRLERDAEASNVVDGPREAQ